jgi:hypothetical protein
LKWFCDIFNGAATGATHYGFSWGMPLASWLLALGGGYDNLCGSDRLSVIPYVHERTELYYT